MAFARDPELVTAALTSLTPTGGRADLSGALRLARGLATPDRPTNVLIFSDGGDVTLPEEPVVGAEFVRFDDFGPNLAVTAWSLEPSTEGTTRAFLQVSNFSGRVRPVRAEVSVNGLSAGLVDLEVPALGAARATTPVDAGPGDVVSVQSARHRRCPGDGRPVGSGRRRRARSQRVDSRRRHHLSSSARRRSRRLLYRRHRTGRRSGRRRRRAARDRSTDLADRAGFASRGSDSHASWSAMLPSPTSGQASRSSTRSTSRRWRWPKPRSSMPPAG